MARADACVHLAAALGVQNIVDNPLDTLLANVRGADVVMAAAARHGCIGSSTSVTGHKSHESLTRTTMSEVPAVSDVPTS